MWDGRTGERIAEALERLLRAHGLTGPGTRPGARCAPEARAGVGPHALPAAAAEAGSAPGPAAACRGRALGAAGAARAQPAGPDAVALPEDGARPGRGAAGTTPRIELLWRYNQHYFDDLNADGAAAQRDGWHRALVRRWIDENPPAPRHGLGAVSGVAAHRQLDQVVRWAASAPEPAWLHSLAVQARWLTASGWNGTCWATTCSPTPRRWCLPACSSTGPRPKPGWHDGPAHPASANCPSRSWPTAASSSAARCTTRWRWRTCWTC